jgi:hypothetical protein
MFLFSTGKPKNPVLITTLRHEAVIRKSSRGVSSFPEESRSDGCQTMTQNGIYRFALRAVIR